MGAKFTIFAACAGLAMLGMTGAGMTSETTSVLKTDLAGVDGTEANIVVFDVDADWETVNHIHPGHVFVYVTDGAILVDVEGKEPVTYTAGEAFYELPDIPMVARTASTDGGASFIVFQVGPTGEPIMVEHTE